jgi:predicted nucleic acid-binding protein
MGAIDRLRGRTVYLDANIVIYIVEGFVVFRDLLRELAEALTRGEFSAITSELTLAEVLVKPFRAADRQYETTYMTLLNGREALRVMPIDRDVLIRAARIRADHHARLPDAIHLATALNHRCSLFLTNDDRLRAPTDIAVLTLSDLSQP